MPSLPRKLGALPGAHFQDAHINWPEQIMGNTINNSIKNAEIAAKFARLAQLKDGWYNGDGVAFDPDNLECMAKIFAVYYSESLPLPQIVPSVDGDIVVEWGFEGSGYEGCPSVEINIVDKTANLQIFGLGDEDDLIEKDFQLNNYDSIVEFFKFLKAHIK
jgi:hypothetical protein